jgi:helicase MOV-10
VYKELYIKFNFEHRRFLIFPNRFRFEIVFGSPGSGKSSLAVEAIAQIVVLRPKAKILVTANSNSACDELGERLLKYLSIRQVFRFYSPSRINELDERQKKLLLVKCSNLDTDINVARRVYESEIMNYNVVISTIVNCGRLMQLPVTHFDYVIIDECASVSEVFTTIPLSLVMNGQKRNFKASFTFLGDPKQLSAIVHSPFSEKLGTNISIMERAMKLKPYQYDPLNGYDEKYIVQLTNNFRSHQSIIDFSSQSFYNSKLVSYQKKEIANLALKWKELPNKDVPIIFQASWQPSEKDGKSFFNKGDLSYVEKYVRKLLKEGINGTKITHEDIGIISPYAGQQRKLQKMFSNKIEIGTVEYFQGREKLIVIVTTVRSATKTIGFLNNPKRLNVALTRAKALLIVIGNPETLGKDALFSRFIAFCHERNACVGNIPAWVIRKGTAKSKVSSSLSSSNSDLIHSFENFNLDG